MVKPTRHTVPLLIPTTNPIRNIEFSPGVPDTALVIFEEQPPQLHSLRLAGLFHIFSEVKKGHTNNDVALLDEHSLIPQFKFQAPAAHVAYRPAEKPGTASDELCVVFGDGDTAAHRMQISTRKRLRSPDLDNGCRVAYSNDGSVLAVGSTQGSVAGYAVEGRDIAELRSHKFPGSINALCIEQDNCIVRVATDFNSLMSFGIQGYVMEEGDWERVHFTPEDERTIKSMKLHAMVASKRTGLIACAGIGNDIYVTGNDQHLGRRCKVPNFNSIRKLQFADDRNELLVFGDAGLRIISCAVEGGIPKFSATCGGFGDVSERATLVGFHQYGDLLCTALALNE